MQKMGEALRRKATEDSEYEERSEHFMNTTGRSHLENESALSQSMIS